MPVRRRTGCLLAVGLLLGLPAWSQTARSATQPPVSTPPPETTGASPNDCLAYQTYISTDANGNEVDTIVCVLGGATGGGIPIGGDPGSGGVGSSGGGGGGGGIPAGNPLTGEEGRALQISLSQATSALKQYPTCAQLFTNFHRDGTQVLANITYRSGDGVSNPLDGRVTCDQGVPAWALVNISQVFICHAFVGAPNPVTTVIHEALHTIGQLESPAVSGAPTSAAIDQMVRQACHTN